MEYKQISAIFPDEMNSVKTAIKIPNPREQNIFQVHARTLTPLHSYLRSTLLMQSIVNLRTRYQKCHGFISKHAYEVSGQLLERESG